MWQSPELDALLGSFRRSRLRTPRCTGRPWQQALLRGGPSPPSSSGPFALAFQRRMRSRRPLQPESLFSFERIPMHPLPARLQNLTRSSPRCLDTMGRPRCPDVPSCASNRLLSLSTSSFVTAGIHWRPCCTRHVGPPVLLNPRQWKHLLSQPSTRHEQTSGIGHCYGRNTEVIGDINPSVVDNDPDS